MIRAAGWIAFALLSGPWAHAVDITASGLTIPFFDDAGRLTHKLIAARATAAGPLQNMQDVEIVYFSAKDKDLVVQRLQAAEATWDEKSETLVGRGAVSVSTEENVLTGTGFDFALESSRLMIHHDFKMTNPDFFLTSDRATADLLIEKVARQQLELRDVKRCEATGNLHVVVAAAARKTYRFDEAFSENAVYDGGTRTITLPHRVRFLTDGRESSSNTFEIKLADRAAKP